MFGGRLGELDAYVPEAAGTPAPGGATDRNALSWLKNDYRGALDRARREGKPVFVNFTGYACTNCHWMKANMFSRPEIAAALNGFVLVELYTDGTDAASDANGQLELARFQTSAIPFYAILDPDEKVIATSAGVTRNPQEYLAFLKKGAGGRGPGAGEKTAAPAASPAGGQIADLPRTTLRGDRVSLGGKVVVVNFWATWCVPCVEEIPGFNSLHREFGPKGVVVLGVAMDDEGKEIVEPFLKTHPIDYPVALGSEDLAKRFGLDGYPVTVVFDRSGKQVKRFEGLTGEAALQSAVRQAM
jgi:thiol:disulfide interchange protein DsbD